MKLLRTLYYRLSPKQRRLARRLVFFPVDVADAVFNKRPALVPPKGKIFTGQGNFVADGNKMLQDIISTCTLKPEHHILDIGCGIGRLARPLTEFLNNDGSYQGFDIVNDGIKWCKKHYKKYPNFSFTHVPLTNDLYNLNSKHEAARFIFPYENQSFDLIILTSVFTHMQPDEVNNYMHEISRVLKPGGHCFATFFIINNDSQSYLDNTPEPFFPYRYGDYFLHDQRVKNANIAYRISFVEKLAESAGISIKQFKEGWWAGRNPDACMNFQDVIILGKR